MSRKDGIKFFSCISQNLILQPVLAKLEPVVANVYEGIITSSFEFRSILKAEISHKKGLPGTVLNQDLEIACNNGSIKIIEIQREGKRSQKTSEFLLGSKIKKGSILKDV